MPLVALDAIPQVPLEFINDDHREEARLLNELDEALAEHRAGRTGPETVVACFEVLFEHTKAHFGREEEAMQRSGFPPYQVHKGEHERVLAEMAIEGQAFAQGQDVARLTRYVSDAVPAWFTTHILTMDLITARFVQMRGG